MTEEQFKEHHCGRKKKYDKEQVVNKIRTIKKRKFIQGKINHYKCKYCGWYHIGHKKND